MIKCSKCSRIFDNSIDSICPQCGTECSAERLLQDISLSDFNMPQGIEISGAYKDNTDRKELISMSLDITNRQITSYLHDNSIDNTITGFIVTSFIIALISGGSLNNFVIAGISAFVFILSLVYLIWHSDTFNHIVLDVNKDGINLSLPKEKRKEFFHRDNITQCFCREYEVVKRRHPYKAYALCLLDKQTKIYDILLELPSPYLARYFEQEFEKILQIKDVPVTCEHDYQRKIANSELSQKLETTQQQNILADSEILRSSGSFTTAQMQPASTEQTFEIGDVPLFAYFNYEETPDRITLKKITEWKTIIKEIVLLAISDIVLSSITSYIVASTRYQTEFMSVFPLVLCIGTLVMGIIYCLFYSLQNISYEITIDDFGITKYIGILPEQKKMSLKKPLNDADKIRAFECSAQSSITALRLFLKDGSYINLIEQIQDPQQAEYFAYRMNNFIKNKQHNNTHN